jgi:DNA-binding XRE family transcriptional regulator
VNSPKEKLVENLRKNLRLVRQAMKLRQDELGTMAGVSRQTINNIENFRSPMSDTVYIAIAAIIDSYKNRDRMVFRIIEVILRSGCDDECPNPIIDGSFVNGWLAVINHYTGDDL